MRTPGAFLARIDPDAIRDRLGLAWQIGFWNRLSDVYRQEIDRRIATVVEHVIARARLEPGQRVLDVGTGTGSVAARAAPLVAPGGTVIGIDISPRMLALARRRAAGLGLDNVGLLQGRAEAIPAGDGAFDALLASLSLMYAIDRAGAARECARVLRPGGRFVAAVWAGPEQCDLVLFQQTASPFAPARTGRGVGSGALADSASFLARLADAGIDARVEVETIGFDFDDFASAWDALAGAATAKLVADRHGSVRSAVFAAMWPGGDGPRHFRNVVQFIVGRRRG